MGGSHFCLTETELRALLFYAPIMTPRAAVEAEAYVCEMPEGGAEVQPSSISLKETGWPRAHCAGNR